MLPQNASLHSETLFRHASDFLKTCPPALYEEVAVSGSVARGIADQYSDCEIGFWVNALRPDDYKTWLESLGNHAKLRRESPDGLIAIYLEYDVDGLMFDTIWQTWDNLENVVRVVNENRLPNREADVWMLAHLIPMGDAPRLKSYQARVTTYPDELRLNVIKERLQSWHWRMGIPKLFIGESAARRGQLYELRRRQLWSIQDIFAMLFAYNRLWLPEAKWYAEEAKRMTHKPSNLVERMDTLLTERDPYTVLETMRQLQIDTLKILSSDFEVKDLISGFEAIDIKA